MNHWKLALLCLVALVTRTVPTHAAGDLDDEGPVVGIDLGTTNSRVGVFHRGSEGSRAAVRCTVDSSLWSGRNSEELALLTAGPGHVEIVPDELGSRATPSFVGWDDNDVPVVGEAAQRQATINPARTVFDAKRLIGRKYVCLPSVGRHRAVVPWAAAVAFLRSLAEVKLRTVWL